MNMRHEKKGGCILRELFWAKTLGVDQTYLFTCPLSEAHMGVKVLVSSSRTKP